MGTYACGKVDGRLAKLVEKEVRWYLHQEVPNEENAHSRLELGRRQVEVPFQPSQPSRCDVVANSSCR